LSGYPCDGNPVNKGGFRRLLGRNGRAIPTGDARLARLIAQAPPQPGQVFDNLYFVGSAWVGAWVLKISQGLILIDTLKVMGECARTQRDRFGMEAASERRVAQQLHRLPVQPVSGQALLQQPSALRTVRIHRAFDRVGRRAGLAPLRVQAFELRQHGAVVGRHLQGPGHHGR
jgi:hypothetical protein